MIGRSIDHAVQLTLVQKARLLVGCLPLVFFSIVTGALIRIPCTVRKFRHAARRYS
jgi:hypothetical protein